MCKDFEFVQRLKFRIATVHLLSVACIWVTLTVECERRDRRGKFAVLSSIIKVSRLSNIQSEHPVLWALTAQVVGACFEQVLVQFNYLCESGHSKDTTYSKTCCAFYCTWLQHYFKTMRHPKTRLSPQNHFAGSCTIFIVTVSLHYRVVAPWGYVL